MSTRADHSQWAMVELNCVQLSQNLFGGNRSELLHCMMGNTCEDIKVSICETCNILPYQLCIHTPGRYEMSQEHLSCPSRQTQQQPTNHSMAMQYYLRLYQQLMLKLKYILSLEF